MRQSLRGIAASVILLILCGHPAQAGGQNPSAVVSDLQAGLLETMKQAKRLGIKGRYGQLKPVINQSFHLPLMIATASAPYWRAGTPAQRARLLTAFQHMSASTVATFFDDYGGETFRIVRERKTQGPTVLVDTEIVRPDKDSINITYVTAKLQDRWWIIDIIVGGGISEIKVRRNDYLTLLKGGGLDRLADGLNATAERLLSGTKTVAAGRN